LWLFFVAPILGGIIAALVWNVLGRSSPAAARA
jgi:glycerol uptake facilitator-like aquaporin